MASIEQIVTRWVRDVRKTDGEPRYLNDSTSNVKVYPDAGDHRLYSYGSHFELARWVKPQTTGKRASRHAGFWLLNGDTYSVSTSRHQREVRQAVEDTGAPVLILPHTPAQRAGIDLASIVPVEITADRWEPRTYPDAASLPQYYQDSPNGLRWAIENGDVIANPDGTYKLIRGEHRLGESVFHASYGANAWSPGAPMGSAYFLSAFDAQERTRHYFLAQLPAKARPVSVKDAFEALRPALVTDADKTGVQVTRQGDIFAVPSPLTTRELRKAADGATPVKAGPLLGQRHTATEMIHLTTAGLTYARGILTHTGGEHRRQAMGDRKTWHLIVKNTVPTDQHGNNRAWSQVGNVD
jgi:hypothetical protein